MNSRTAATSMMLAAAMMGMDYGKRADRPHARPTTTREKQAKNRYRRAKGKR